MTVRARVPPGEETSPHEEQLDDLPRCTCTEDESSDGSATYEDDPECPIHGWLA